jgi:hypothetical protein
MHPRRAGRQSLVLGIVTLALVLLVTAAALATAAAGNSAAADRLLSRPLMVIAGLGTLLAVAGLGLGALGMRGTATSPRRRNQALTGMVLNFLSLVLFLPVVIALAFNASVALLEAGLR